jgi:hypothetical protein
VVFDKLMRKRYRSASGCASPVVSELHPVGKPDDEVVGVRHLHLRQGLGVDHIVRADDLVLLQDERRQRVDLVVGQRLRGRPGHRPAREVEDRRRGTPETGNGLRRLDPVDRRAADQRAVSATLGAFAMTGRAAFLGIDLGTLRRRAAAGRQAGAVAENADVPGLEVALADRPAEIGRFRVRRADGGEQHRGD